MVPSMRVLGFTACIVAWAAGAAPVLSAAAVPAGAARTVTARPPRPVLPFLADDYTRAVAEARARKVPLFIEAWAPW